jgi:NRAMP (natural resistance-associated macrophage protein)-like metal ion transporter
MKTFKKFFRIFGPGVITGASDDDPSGIATYSQTGAQFGYGQLWAAVFMLPFQTAIQEASARIGAVTGQGIAAVIRKHYSQKVLYAVVFLVLIANIINIGADIGAMAEAAHLILPVNFVILTLLFTVVTLVLEIFISYKKYSRILMWLCLTLISYPLTVFIVTQPWWTLLKATFIPHIEFSFQFLFIITGVLGTTISPYLFFWQASQEVEEEHSKHLIKRNDVPHINKRFMRNLRIDNFVGMLFSEIGAWSIIVVSATVLHAHGITDIKTAADAAKALEPLVQTFPHAGYIAKFIFAIGIIGLGLLSVPVLAGSAAYAISEAFDWKSGLNFKLKKAHGFYGVITIATLIGLCINFIGINPFKALIYAAVINGIVAVPLIFIIGLIAKNEKIMGNHKSGWLSTIFVWLTFFGMAAAAVAMFFTFGRS